MKTPCEDGLFGDPSIGICGPCMCAVGMHLNPVCNKTTGACYCNVSATSSLTCDQAFIFFPRTEKNEKERERERKKKR